MASPQRTRPQTAKPSTPPRDDGDEALQAFQDALARRLAVRGLLSDGSLPVRVFAWTIDDAHLNPAISEAFGALAGAERVLTAAIPEDAPGRVRADPPDLIVQVTRLDPIPSTGTRWQCLVPMPLRLAREAFSDGGEEERAWVLDSLERQVLAAFWNDAYAAPPR